MRLKHVGGHKPDCSEYFSAIQKAVEAEIARLALDVKVLAVDPCWVILSWGDNRWHFNPELLLRNSYEIGYRVPTAAWWKLMMG
jgi:hypothetical protein